MKFPEIESDPEQAPLYPLRFAPVYKHYLWGGDRFRALFRRSVPGRETAVAESWEIADHPHGESVIQNGPLKGYRLGDLVRQRPQSLFGPGRFDPQSPPTRFPLLLKYLDAVQALSIQVHPSDRLAREMGLEDSGKTEVWVVVDAEPGSGLWLGTNRPMTKGELEDAVRRGETESVMNWIPVEVGDCFHIPPGTLHALGPGILVAEVQTSSDATFRVFDWNRVDAEGKRRALRLSEAIRALNASEAPARRQIPGATAFPNCERLVVEERFTVDRWTLTAPQRRHSDGRCRLWTLLEGSVDLAFQAGRHEAVESLHRGDSILVPAACRDVHWTPGSGARAVLLDVSLDDC